MPLTNYTFHDPWWLLALLALPLLMWLRGRRGAPVLIVPFAASWHRPSLISSSRWPVALAAAGLVLLVVALARPQKVEDKREVKQQGYDLMLAIDLSGSMYAEDYERDGERINRLQAIKPVIQAFIHQRVNDRIGLVVFAGRAYTLAPLTFDHEWLQRQVERLKINMIEDGTAIGDGLGVSLTRLEQAKRADGTKRKGAFVVLMTDGANNRGILTPDQATEIAKSRSIPVYTIGAGKDGLVPMPVFDDSGNKIGYRRAVSDLDEGALRAMSDATGAKFFRAFDSDTIEKAFAAIDAAQKIEFQAKSYLLTTELFAWLAFPSVGLLVLGGLAAVPALTLRADAPATPGRPPALEKIAPPGPVLLGITVALLVINVILGYTLATRRSAPISEVLGYAAGQLIGPLLVVLLFSLGRRFRTARARTLIVLITSIPYFLTNLAGLLR